VIAFGIDEAERGAEAKLVRFAELVDLAVASADARQQLGRAASTDPLTGLPNERSFKERLAAEVERARRHDRELGLVLFDVDDFTRVNDQHGRRVGDRVLRELAQRLRGCLRTGEMLARVGGEEFAWIVTETGGMGAFAAAERARAAVADRPFDGVGRLSISAGVCDLAESPGGGGELFRLADVALYWAKANGRDATFRYSPEVVQILSAEQRAGQLERAQAVSAIRVLARAVDAKHPDTREHSERVADLAVLIAQELGWTGERLASLRGAAMVHDVGKISVPDAILLKSGRLDEHEYERIKRHAAIGAEIVAGILNPEEVAWVRHHHERVDGRGYPDGLAGDEISEGAYVLAVADAWDAMTGSRSYRASLSPGEALAECRSVAGRQFPTRAVDALERLWRRGLIGPHGRVAPDPARALSADDPAGGARRP
jgi:diguanylate cyclase (GGDEF)-like protein/putative nucleotidyltransferase with HDIG domain